MNEYKQKNPSIMEGFFVNMKGYEILKYGSINAVYCVLKKRLMYNS